MKRLTPIVALMLGLTALPAQPAEPDELAWMSGHWCGGTSGEVIEEFWMPPHGGVLLGASNTAARARRCTPKSQGRGATARSW